LIVGRELDAELRLSSFILGRLVSLTANSHQTKGFSILRIRGNLTRIVTPYSTVTVSKSNGQQLQSNFALQLANDSLDSVDKDTTPRSYVFQNASDVSGFIGQSLAGEGDVEVTIESFIPIYQIDCSIPNGKYINHLRSKDASGVTYYDFFNLIFSAPDNVQGDDRCEQAAVSIE
jgi:hypothetical protein